MGCNSELIDTPIPFGAVQHPEGNELTPERIQLGRMLFYDPIMSIDSTVSCATCHQQHLAFTDGKKVGEGLEGRKVLRNSPTLANVAYHPRVMRDGGVPTLEMQILVPIQEHAEFNHNIVELAAQLKAHAVYGPLAEKAYNREMDPYVITRSISAFERTMISNQSPFDQYFQQGDKSALSESQLAGYSIFKATGCISCHSGPDFTDYNYHNVGLYKHYPDSGRARITHLPSDRGRIKTPTLRNIALTAPYMHDGNLETLEEVIDHFISGGVDHPQKSDSIKPIEISELEKQQLIAFLKSLTDEEFINETGLSNPFK